MRPASTGPSDAGAAGSGRPSPVVLLEPARLHSLARSFAVTLARRHPELFPLVDDMAQDAAIGLLEALRRFHPEQGTRFETYAWRCMSTYVRRGSLRLRGALSVGRWASDAPSPEELPAADAREAHDLRLDATSLGRRLRRHLSRSLRQSGAERTHARRDAALFVRVTAGFSLARAGARVGISRERARQIHERLQPVFVRWRTRLAQREAARLT